MMSGDSGVVDLTEDDDETEPADPRRVQAKRPRLATKVEPGALPIPRLHTKVEPGALPIPRLHAKVEPGAHAIPRLNMKVEPGMPQNGVWMPPPAAVMPAAVQAPPISSLAEADLSSRIYNSLRGIASGQVAAGPRLPTAAQYQRVNAMIAPKLEIKTESQEPGLQDMLRDSLRSLSSEVAESFQGSQAGQELLRVVQSQPSPGSFLPVKQEAAALHHSSQQLVPREPSLQQPELQPTTLALPAVASQDAVRVADPRLEARHEASKAVKQEVKLEAKQEVKPQVQQEVDIDHGFEVMTEAELSAYPGDDRLPQGSFGLRARERPPIDFDDDDDDEAVPHRLPPGFGAVPEDIIQERARQREEEKIRAIKSRQPCRFGTSCKKRDCMNMHPEGRSIDTNLNPCAFGRRCKRHNCFYDHPEGRLIDDDPTRGVCRLGVRCKRADCLYTHPAGREVPVGSVQVCFFCHEMGHIAQDCPRNPGSWAFNRQAAAQTQLVAIQPGALQAGAETAPAQVPAQ